MRRSGDGRERLGRRPPILAVRALARLPLDELATSCSGAVPTVRRDIVLVTLPTVGGLPAVRVSDVLRLIGH